MGKWTVSGRGPSKEFDSLERAERHAMYRAIYQAVPNGESSTVQLAHPDGTVETITATTTKFAQ